MDTLNWRISLNVRQMIMNGELDLSYEELLTGKTFYLRHDTNGRPINYISVKDHIKEQFISEETEKLTIFYMETDRKMLHSLIENVPIIFDMT
jgi:hypothetical protein